MLGWLLIFSAFLALYFYSERYPKNYPPGPWGLPLVGHLLFMTSSPHIKFMEWKNKYGPIFSVRFGAFRAIVIDDLKLIKEAGTKLELSGRPRLPTFVDRCGGVPRGIIFNDGKDWQEQRKFTLKHLREFGFSASTMHRFVEERVNEFMKNILEEEGTLTDPKLLFNWTSVNVMLSLMAGENVAKDHPGLLECFMRISKNLEDFNILREACQFMPWIARAFPKLSGYEASQRDLEHIVSYVRNFIKSHMNNYEPGKPRSFIDVYLDEIKKTDEETSSFKSDKGEESLLNVVLDLFLAGSETTSTVMQWFVLLMSSHPDVQKKVQIEIDEIIGRSGSPSVLHERSMPYTQAVIQETLRFCSITPLGIFHNSSVAAKIGGYSIPPDTMVVLNLYGLHNDPSTWNHPRSFLPSRFIDDHGNFMRSDSLLPFSTGKRICIGELLAKVEIFYFVTNLLQQFTILADPTCPNPDLDPILSIVLQPKKFRVTFKSR